MTDIDAIIEGLSEAQKDALFVAFQGVCEAQGQCALELLRKGLIKPVNGNGRRLLYTTLTTKGQAVRARLLGDK